MTLSHTQKTHSTYVLDLLGIYTSQKYVHYFCQLKNKILHTLNHVVDILTYRTRVALKTTILFLLKSIM